MTKNFRIQAQILNFESSRLLWLNTYFPTDPGGELFEEEELLGLLTDIENVIDSADFDDILWNGDLNYDPSRTSGFVRKVSRFLSRLGLVSVWETFPVDYTHIHTDFKFTSTLDDFVVNGRLVDFSGTKWLLHHCTVFILSGSCSTHVRMILWL